MDDASNGAAPRAIAGRTVQRDSTDAWDCERFALADAGGCLPSKKAMLQEMTDLWRRDQ